LAELKVAAGTTDELVREMAHTSPAALRLEIDQRTSAIVELEREQTRLERERGKWQTREKEEQARQFDLDPLRKQRKASLADATQLDRQRAAEQAENRTIYSLPRGFDKQGWILVIEAQTISVAPLGRAAKPLVFKSSGISLFGKSAAAALGDWIEREHLRAAYFLVLVRPEASTPFHDVQSLLTDKSISYGFDLIGADETNLNPERGAAP